MDTPAFCGQACHTPMRPQFQAWQGAVHSGACVDCHIGEWAAALVHANLSGVRQLMMVAEAKDGSTISADCEYGHKQIE